MRPAPEMYLRGVRGGRVVIVEHDVAVWLATEFGIAEMHRRNRRKDPKVEAVIVALALAQLEGSEVGTVSAPTSEPARTSEQRTVSTSALAARLNFTSRAITRAITEGRLDASKDDTGHWRITEAEATRFGSSQKGTAA